MRKFQTKFGGESHRLACACEGMYIHAACRMQLVEYMPFLHGKKKLPRMMNMIRNDGGKSHRLGLRRPACLLNRSQSGEGGRRKASNVVSIRLTL